MSKVKEIVDAFIALYNLPGNRRKVIEASAHAFIVFAFLSFIPALWIENLNAVSQGESILYRIPVVLILIVTFLACIILNHIACKKWVH